MNLQLNGTEFECTKAQMKLLTAENLSSVKIDGEDMGEMVIGTKYPYNNNYRFSLRNRTELEERFLDLEMALTEVYELLG